MSTHIWSFYNQGNLVINSYPFRSTQWNMQSKEQCLKLSQKSCRSSWPESQIMNIKLKKNQQKVPGSPPKLSASDWRTCGNFQHWQTKSIPWDLIQYKMTSYQYKKSRCGDKTVIRPSYLHNGISYTGKMSSLYMYWIGALTTDALILVMLPGYQQPWY